MTNEKNNDDTELSRPMVYLCIALFLVLFWWVVIHSIVEFFGRR